MKLIHRIKVLLSLAQELGPQIEAQRFQHLLFLYCTEAVKSDGYYAFIPSAAGPHSLQAQEDKGSLIHKGYLSDAHHWQTIDGTARAAIDLDFFEKIAIQDIKKKWIEQPDTLITEHIRTHYPAYFSTSATTAPQETVFYTIGYEGASIEAYLNTLLAHGVTLLCDVRKNSFSQKFGFSKQELKSALASVGIAFQHIPELGIVSEKRQHLVSDNDYDALFKEYETVTLSQHTAKLDLLVTLLNQHRRVAITCFEADPKHCHRGRIAKTLRARPDFTHRIEHLHP